MSLKNLKKLIEKFEHAQIEFGEFGAADSEPEEHFHWLLWNCWETGENSTTRSARDWQLFNKEGVSVAAEGLAKAANKCVFLVKKIRNSPGKEREDTEKFLRTYCWRIYI